MEEDEKVWARACLFCGKAFKAKSEKAKYCTRGCANRGSASHRGDRLRGRGAGKVRCPKLAGKPMYRTLVEWALGVALPPSILVHHLDGNPLNNALSNLSLVTRAEHCRIHQPELSEGRRRAAEARRAVNRPVSLGQRNVEAAA